MKKLTYFFAPAFITTFAISSPSAVFAQSTGTVSIQQAINDAEAGKPVNTAAYANDPLYGWLEYALLRRNINTISTSQADAFLKRYGQQAAGQMFREYWLPATSRRNDWNAFLRAWNPSIKSTTLRCMALTAKQATTGNTDAPWIQEAQSIWRDASKTLPKECTSPMRILEAKGGITPEMRWQRFDLAAEAWQADAMREAAAGLPAAESALANTYASFVQTPNGASLNWPKTARSRLVASAGLAKLGKANPDQAEALLPQYASTYAMTEAERGRVLYQIALWTAASYKPGAARRLAAVPAVSYDNSLHEWRVREALSRSDWKTAAYGIEQMGAEQRSDSRWTYFLARLKEKAGDAGAAALYRDAAMKPEFHGFLAADRLNQNYNLCPIKLTATDATRVAVTREAALTRALALQNINRTPWAEREWKDALSRFDANQRQWAVKVAQDAGWFDRGVFGLVNVNGQRYADELRLYDLRFPIHHMDTIRREAKKNALDEAWVAAEIRAESIFNPRARSPANARGLMQLIPSTGAATAKRVGLAYSGVDQLYDPDTNIILGTAYLRQMEDKYGVPYYAIAAYNAGPAPVARWQSQRPNMDADFWIETITYKETRDYVARVLAFSVMYDWRMNGSALPVSQRMQGSMTGKRKPFACATPQTTAALSE